MIQNELTESEKDDIAHSAIIDRDSVYRDEYLDVISDLGPEIFSRLYELTENISSSSFDMNKFDIKPIKSIKNKLVFALYENNKLMVTSEDIKTVIEMMIDVNLSSQVRAGINAKNLCMEVHEEIKDQVS